MSDFEEKFGEKRPLHQPTDKPAPDKDEWGNDKRKFELHPVKIERGCQCTEHTMLIYSVEAEMPTISDPQELFRMMIAQEPIPHAKQWVPIMRVSVTNN